MAIQPVVLHEPTDPSDILTLPGSTVDLQRGDLTSWESSVLVLMDLVTEDITFAGFMLNQYTDDLRAPQQCLVALKGTLKIDCTSAAYAGFAPLKWGASNSLVADGSANTIAYAACYHGTVTRMKAYFNVPALGKLFAVSA